MDYVTRQFIFLAKKFRKELRKAHESLHRDLVRLSDRLKDVKDTISAQQNSDQEYPQTPSSTVAELRTKIPIRVETKAEQSDGERIWGKIKSTLEVFAFAAVIVYTGVSFEQWCAMRDTLRESRKQTGISQNQLEATTRPWIGIPEPITSVGKSEIATLPPPSEQISESVNISFKFKNYGHSPAIGVGYEFFLVVGGPKEHQFRDHEVCERAAGAANKATHTHSEGFKFGTTVFPDTVSGPQVYDTGTVAINRTDDVAWLVGCVAYVGEPRDRVYFTRLFYKITRQKTAILQGGFKYYPIAGFEPFYVDTDTTPDQH